MEQKDMELISRFSSQDPELAELFRQHLDFEKELEKIENKSYLTVAEQMRRAEIKKLKLAGKDRIEAILKKYRKVA